MTETLDATILTLSFSGDFDVCRLLCESVDRYAPPGMAHLVYVPTKDLPLFAPLANARRKILSQDRDLLPGWMMKLPMPGPRLRAALRLPRRNIYLSLFSPPVRGWIAQQIMKIAAAAVAPTEVILHVDSDTMFIRPLTAARLVHDGRVRLYQNPQRVELESHRLWNEAASRLLGLPPDAYHAGDYIGPLVVWRRSLAQQLIARLERVGGADWRKLLARTPHFSEYTLYGAFAEAALGLDAAGLWADADSLCHSLWSDEISSVDEEDAFVEALRPSAIACLVQSTVPLALDERRRLIDRVARQAALQDARS